MGWKIEVLDVPPSLNKVLRMHWAKRARLKGEWARQFYRMPEFQDIAHGAGCRRKMKMTVTIHNSRQYDKDNAYGACKILADGAKEVGVIYDDRREFLDLEVKQEKCKRKDKKTVIELELA